jgi:hypothetical protein
VVRSVLALVLAAGCGVRLADDPMAHAITDAHPGADAPATPADAAAPPVDARPCTGTLAPGGACLVFVTGPATWVDAKAACVAMAAHLAILDSAAKDSVAEALLTVDTFIGGTDAVTEGSFLWVDGTPVGFTNWHTGEPNNGAGAYEEDCIVVAGARVGKGWDDRPCAPETGALVGGKYAYLCEY